MLYILMLKTMLLGYFTPKTPDLKVENKETISLNQDTTQVYKTYLGNFQVGENHWLTVSRVRRVKNEY